MIAAPPGGRPPQINKALKLHETMLSLAQELLVEELIESTLCACGDGFTARFAGQYGLYETLGGEVVSFQPKPELTFMLICDDFIATGTLATIKAITRQLDEYDLLAIQPR